MTFSFYSPSFQKIFANHLRAIAIWGALAAGN